MTEHELSSTADAWRRYNAAVAAVLEGVKRLSTHSDKETDAQILRLGVNSALVDSGGLARLLLNKGVISEQEYANALADTMEEEQIRYEKKISDMEGFSVPLS